jgi:two-component system, chemotaxis family, sensor kinase CheA
MTLDPVTRARLVGLFVAEAEETIEALREHAATLGRGADPERLSEFGRVAHGLKGAAAGLGFQEVARALHQLEELALGLRDLDGDGARVRLGRVSSAIETFAEGVERMSAAALDAYPGDVLARLFRAMSPPAGGAATDSAATTAALAGTPPEPATTDPTSSRPASDAGERLSVPASDVDEALRLAASVARAAAQLQEAIAETEGPIATSAQLLAASAAGLESIIASLRLIPAGLALAGLETEVAELSRRLGKEVVWSITGRDVRADRRTLQTARGLIRHLIRNALDHGIEAPDARVAAGKRRRGGLALRIEAVESSLRVEVADDGGGFDVPAIRAELSRRGDAADVQSLSDEEVLQRWALEGGSTRARATDVSGRGLGLSAVAQAARAAGGGVQVRSARGHGSTVTFTLPLEVYAVEALTLTVAGRTFGLPVSAVERNVFLAASGEAVQDGPAGRTVAVGETILPLVPLADAIGVGRGTGRERFAVVVRAEGVMGALAADDVGAVMGLVPASVPGIAQADALVSGLARLADGTPVAILNPRLLLTRVRAVRTARAGAPAPARAAARAVARAAGLDIVLAEDSLATREVLRVLLEEEGFRVRPAGDGEEALSRIAESIPDVLVSDVNMPRRDGLSLTRALRARKGTERLPIVLLTSQDDAATRAAGAEAGADAYLLKSQFNASVLAETLARLGVLKP